MVRRIEQRERRRQKKPLNFQFDKTESNPRPTQRIVPESAIRPAIGIIEFTINKFSHKTIYDYATIRD